MSLGRRLKIVILLVVRLLGGFKLAGWLTRDQARIVCYHGFAYRNEHEFAPQLFMSPSTFGRRLDLIARSGLKPARLDDLVTSLEQGRPIGKLLVFTVDDGWTGFERFAWPLLRSRDWPCTLYVTTWYAGKGLPVLNVLRRYLAWRGLALPPPAEAATEEHRQLATAAAANGVDLSCTDRELFALSSIPGLARMAAEGLDLQLHTHRHRLPADPGQLKAEIDDNRRCLRQSTAAPAEHLCYPSGEYDVAQIAPLRAMGVRSATTTRLGLVGRGADRWQLPRLLDSEHLLDVEFEAELCGLMPLLRRWAARDATSAGSGG